MSFLDTKHKRKSAIWTTIIGIVILFLIFNFGMRYFDPPKEFGISVNFGTSNVGSGDMQPTESLKPATKELEPIEKEEIVEEQVVEEPIVEEQVATAPPKSETTSEEVITQENEEAIAIKKQKEAKRLKETERLKEIEEQQKADRKATEERKKIEAENRRIEKEKQEKIDAENKRIEKEKQKKAAEMAAKKAKFDALIGGVGNTDGKADGGEGDDDQAGDKGKPTGDLNASPYYGNSGTGSGGSYQLGNRKALTRPKPFFDCNEIGIVVVRITVDKLGNVIDAQPGVQGTTNTLECLLKRAKEAAQKTKFSPDSEAQAKQMGKIIYNFSYLK